MQRETTGLLKLAGVAGLVHELRFEFGQLVVIIVNGVKGRGYGGIIVHECDHGAVGVGVENRQHSADAASRSDAGVAIPLMDLFHRDDAVAELAQKSLIGIRGDNRRVHQCAHSVEIVEYGFQ